MNNRKERNYGIELMRVFAMLMIVILHINMNGGLMGCFKEVDSNYIALWFGESFCFASVTCYALISGYVMHNHKASAGKLLCTWAQVFVISAVAGLYFWLVKNPEIPADKIAAAFRPLTKSQYWYFTAYFGMYLIVPVLVAAVSALDRLTHKKVIVLIIVFYTILPIILENDLFRHSNGMGSFWLSLMFIVGAYFGKYGVNKEKFPPVLCGIGAFVCGLVLATIVINHSYWVGEETGAVSGQFDYLFYTNPLTVVQAILLLMCFSQLEFKNGKIRSVIKWLGASSFSVYLIHTQPLIFDYAFNGAFQFLGKYNAVVMSLLVILLAMAVYLICVLLDNVRLLAFRLLGIDKGLVWVGNKLDSLLTFVIK